MEGVLRRHTRHVFRGVSSRFAHSFRFPWLVPRFGVAEPRAVVLVITSWTLLLLYVSSGVHSLRVSEDSVAQPLVEPASPPFNGDMPSSKGTPTYNSPSLRSGFSESRALGGRRASVGNKAQLSLVEQGRATQAEQSGPVRQGRFSTFHELASAAYQNWETIADADGRRLLALIAEEVEKAGTQRYARGLALLMGLSIPFGTVFQLELTHAGTREAATKKQKVKRGEVLGTGNFKLVYAARLRSGALQAARGALRGLVTTVRDCGKDGSCVSKGSRRPPREKADENVALRIAYSATASGAAPTQEWAEKLVNVLRTRQVQSSPFPEGVSHEQLLRSYGFAVPQYFGHVTGMPALLARQGNVGILNYWELLPRMRADLREMPQVKDVRVMQFLVKRLLQLVAHLEAAGIVHTGIKGENFLVDRTGQVYLIDFDEVHKTGQKVRCGELLQPGYCDPETVTCMLESPDRETEVTPAQDAWSLGMVLFDMACKKLPFRGMDPTERHSRENAMIVASLLKPSTPTSDGSGGKAVVDWTGCEQTPPHLRDIMEKLLDPSRKTRLNPLTFYKTSEFFAAGRNSSELQTGASPGQAPPATKT